MYKITFYRDGTRTLLDFKEFSSLDEAIQFTTTINKDSVIEIKYYDDKAIDLSYKPNTNR